MVLAISSVSVSRCECNGLIHLAITFSISDLIKNLTVDCRSTQQNFYAKDEKRTPFPNNNNSFRPLYW